MITAIPRATRRSRALVDWSARFCFERPDQALDAMTGETATFARATPASGIDFGGRLAQYGHTQPAWEWNDLDADGIREAAGITLQPALANVVLWNRDLTNAAWAKTSVTPVKDQVGVDGVANSASRITATAANGTCLQAITLASSQRFQTAYVMRLVGSGPIQMTTDGGTTWTNITVTATWTRVSIPAQTVTNPSVGFRIATSGDSIAVDLVQNETGAYATSPMPTTTASVSVNAHRLFIAYNALVQAMSVWLDLTEATPTNLANGTRLLEIGDSGSTGAYFSVQRSATGFQAVFHNGSQSVTASVTVTAQAGDRVRIRVTMDETGAVTIAAQVNAAAEIVGTATAANAFASTASWNQARLTLGADYSGTNAAAQNVRRARVDPGVRTAAYLGAG